MRGRLLLTGSRWDDLSIRDLADVAEALIVDGVNGLVDRGEVMQKLQEGIDRSWPDRETWGMSDEAMRQQDAMMAAAPGRAEP